MTSQLNELIQAELVLDIPWCMEGWTSADVGLEMAELVIQEKPLVIVEIGCFGGRSALAMGLACRENNMGKVYTIDPWKKDWAVEQEQDQANVDWWKGLDIDFVHRRAMDFFWKHNMDEWIIPIRAASQFVHQLFPVIDMLNIDGCHSELASCRDVALFVPQVKTGGYIWFDDTNWKSTKQAQREMDAFCETVKDYGSHKLYRRQRGNGFDP